MNLKMVKSGLVLACVALAQWVSAQQAPQMEASVSYTHLRAHET